ncbi:MAG: hypothetical protein LBC02_10015 [Planctomycetaceae bacterium]|jgi:hypothetical protein|nr:hypothetical protein [Planctomycetaceae bacterium]
MAGENVAQRSDCMELPKNKEWELLKIQIVFHKEHKAVNEHRCIFNCEKHENSRKTLLVHFSCFRRFFLVNLNILHFGYFMRSLRYVPACHIIQKTKNKWKFFTVQSISHRASVCFCCFVGLVLNLFIVYSLSTY